MASSQKMMGRPEDFDHPVYSGDSQRFTDGEGNEEWRNSKNQLHREDGPAMVWADGTRKWYYNGVLHREDGPAIEWGSTRSGREDAWYIDGEPQDTAEMEQKMRDRQAAAEAFAKAVAIAEANTNFGTTRTVLLPKTASFKKARPA